MNLAARAPGGRPPADFVPYAHGAALGRPSRGRPEKVLAHLKTTTTIRREDEVGIKPAPGSQPRNGRPAGGGYEYGGTGKDTGVTASMGAARLRHEAALAVPGAVGDAVPSPEPARRKPAARKAPRPAPAVFSVPASPPEPGPAPEPAAGERAPKPRKPMQRAVLTTCCPGCGRPKPDRYATCGGAGPCLAPRQAPEPEPEAAPVPLPEPEAAPAPAKRHRKCGYPVGSVGHKTMCGDA